jgi:hypothetical protein
MKNDLPHEAVLNFASTVKNVCDGVGAVLALAYAHEGERLQDGLGAETTVSMLEMESLMNLARTSTRMLHNEAERIERWAGVQHSDAGAMEAYECAASVLERRGLEVPRV